MTRGMLSLVGDWLMVGVFVLRLTGCPDTRTTRVCLGLVLTLSVVLMFAD